MTTTAALTIARERQLDWLLEEVLGGATRGHARSPARAWLAAALVVLGATVAFGAAWLHRSATDTPAQDPDEAIDWVECHGVSQLERVPVDVANLRCFDFDDAAIAQLAPFRRLQRLDLSGMDVNDRGYSVALKITDAGLAHLAVLTELRWLSLAGCHDLKGSGLRVLENLPRFEHLDLTYTGVESPAIERLPELARLRELSLSSCMQFHGRSLAAVAKIPGLRRLELRACTTLAAADVMQLARLSQLRHLDLRDCQGRFRGQRMSDGSEREDPPVEDGIGITDAAVAALGDLRLETLLLGGSESLTDAIGPTLATMTTLRTLDLSNLPKATNALLANVPGQLTALQLGHSRQFSDAGLQSLPRLPELRELGLEATSGFSDRGIRDLLGEHRLQALSLGGVRQATKVGELFRRDLGDGLAAAIAAQTGLRRLVLAHCRIDAGALDHVAALPQLDELDLSSSLVAAGALPHLAASRSLTNLVLTRTTGIDADDLRRVPPSLRRIDLYGTDLGATEIARLARAWPDCTLRMPNGRRLQVPDRR